MEGKSKKEIVYKAEDVLEKLNNWYKFIDYYARGTKLEKELRNDMDYIRDAILEFNKDKQIDRLRFAKKFKALFEKKNKELAKEVFEVKKELFEAKVKKQILEKELEREKK